MRVASFDVPTVPLKRSTRFVQFCACQVKSGIAESDALPAGNFRRFLLIITKLSLSDLLDEEGEPVCPRISRD